MYKVLKINLEQLFELQEVAITTFREAFAHENDKTHFEDYISSKFSKAHLHEELTDPGSWFFFIKEDSKTVGYLKVNFPGSQTDLNEKDSLEIERIYIRRSEQGKGAGYQLLKKSIELAAERQCRYIWLGVWEHNLNAIDFYRKTGFKVFGEHQFMMGAEVQIDLLMRLEMSYE